MIEDCPQTIASFKKNSLDIAWFSKGHTLHTARICRAMHQIGCDMKRRVIAEDLTKIGTLAIYRDRLTLYTINFTRMCFTSYRIRCNLSESFKHVQNVSTACDSLRFLESWPTESQKVSHYTMSLRRRRRGGPSQGIASSKSCGVPYGGIKDKL